MPVQYSFESTIILIEAIGEYSKDDLRTVILNSMNDPLHKDNFSLLIDLTQSLSIYKRSSEEINEMASFVSSLAEHFNKRIALVSPQDLPYGMMRMSTAGSGEIGITSGVFRTLAEARKWLLL
jgi:hypothetical protein